MRLSLLLFLLLLLPRAFAQDGVEVFRAGLQAFQANGPDALLNTWYNQGEEVITAPLRERLQREAQALGDVIGVEVFAPHSLGRHVQRLYGVIYFRRRPLWLRAEYYRIDGRDGFISLEFSRTADDILPLQFGVSSH